MLKLEGVTKRYEGETGSIEALSKIDLEVRKGEFVCVLGPSGCGKSTLLGLIAGLDVPSSGRILLDGQPVEGPGPDRVVIFQEAALFPWLTVLGNVEFGLKLKGVPAPQRRARALEAIDLVRLTRFKDYRPHQLSGGMKQRAAIARGAVLLPRILLMDEPFAALDAQTRDLLHVELQEVWQRTGLTIVFVTHNVREAACLGNRIILMGANPGSIRKEYPVDLPRPRSLEDLHVMELAATVTQQLKKEAGDELVD